MRKLAMIVVVGCAMCACAPRLGPLTAQLDKGAHEGAVALASGDSEMEHHLAVLILERAVTAHPERSRELLLPASRCEEAGKWVLRRLSKGDEDGVPAQVATVLRYARRSPRRHNAYDYLESTYDDVRATVATTYGWRLDKTTLVALAGDVNPVVRGAAVAALCREGGDQGAQIAREALRLDPVPHVRGTAARCGSSLGDDAVDALRVVLEREENEGVKKAALTGLVRIGSPEAIGALRETMMGPMTPLKVQAAAMLCGLGNRDGQARMRDALADANPVVRAAAIGQLGVADLVDGNDIRADALVDEPAVALVSAISLLPHEEHAQAAQERLLVLWKEGGAQSGAARLALANHGNPEALASFAAELKDATDMDDAALVSLLVSVGGVTGLRSEVVAMMGNESESVRVAAARAIVQQCEE